jgi:hypothetical protein
LGVGSLHVGVVQHCHDSKVEVESAVSEHWERAGWMVCEVEDAFDICVDEFWPYETGAVEGYCPVRVAGDGPTVPMEERVVAATVRGRVASAASPMGLHHHEEREEVRLVGWPIVCVLDDVMRVEAISATASWPSAALIAFFQAST